MVTPRPASVAQAKRGKVSQPPVLIAAADAHPGGQRDRATGSAPR